MSILLILIPLILIVLEGIFAASETGLVSIEYIRVRQAKREKQSWAQIVSNFLARPERFFSTILVCENFILVVSSTLFAKFFIDWLGPSGAIFATLLLAIVSLAVGQFIPKSIAFSYNWMGIEHMRTGNLTSAETHFRRSVDLAGHYSGPIPSTALYKLGQIRELQRDYRGAREYYLRSKNADPHNPAPAIRLRYLKEGWTYR